MSDTKVFICHRRRTELSPAGKRQLNHFARLTPDQKYQIKTFICRETWLKDVIEKCMPNAAAIMRLEYFLVYLGLYVSHGKAPISLQDFDQSNPCVRATVEFIQENHEWLRPMIDYYAPLLKNSLLERNFRKLMRRNERESESMHDEWNVEEFEQFLIQLAEPFLAENCKSDAAGGGMRPKRKQIKVPKEFWADLESPPQIETNVDEFGNSVYFAVGNGLSNGTPKRVTRRDGYSPMNLSRNAQHRRRRSRSVESRSPARHLGDKAFAKVFAIENDDMHSRTGRKTPRNDFTVEKLMRNAKRRRPRHRSPTGESVSPMRRLNAAITTANEFKNSKLSSNLFATGKEYSYGRNRPTNRGNYSAINARQRRQRHGSRSSSESPSPRRYFNSTKLLADSKFRNSKWHSDDLSAVNEHYSSYSTPNYGFPESDFAAADAHLSQHARRQRRHSIGAKSDSPIRRFSREAFSPENQFQATKYFEDVNDYTNPNPMERRKTIGNIYTLNDARLNSLYQDHDYFYDDDDWQ